MNRFLPSSLSGPPVPPRHCVVLGLLLAGSIWPACLVQGQERDDVPRARIFQEVRTLQTYPFSEPNPVPVLTRDRRLYPYHTFEGYAHSPEPRDWTVVTLENDYIQVFVLPEAGGKVWGAVVKATGHEFIYRNEVMKFRNIALRGPWTSGGIEFNFGVIGHTPSTATPVDYTLQENADGSVSCWVGSMDLPSRTHWRVEIRLPADEATFETNVLWYNPTPLEQPYYNWMTAAAFARPDLEMTMPGDAFLQHSGQVEDWPVDPEGRYLPAYDNNRFGGHKSYHVVGEIHDFFGGYYHDAGYGFGHWARYEDMPGQKLWLWALSREGGVWEELLTDADGQYVEFQAGRLLVQYSPGSHQNPITQAGFDPLSASGWTERWFPVEGLGGLTEASPHGALHVEEGEGHLTIRVNAFREVTDTLRVWVGDDVIPAVPSAPPHAVVPVALDVLEPGRFEVDVPEGLDYRVRLPALELDYNSWSEGRRLLRPFETDSVAFLSMPEARRAVFQAQEFLKGRRYVEAGELFHRALELEPWNREALLGTAAVALHQGRPAVALRFADRARQLDAYDAEANFLAGVSFRGMMGGLPPGPLAEGDTTAPEPGVDEYSIPVLATQAREAFTWAARSVAFRSAAYVQLAELALAEGVGAEALRYARLATDFDRHSVSAWQIVALVGRISNDDGLKGKAREELSALDPLHHFLAAEAYLDSERSPGDATRLTAAMGGEYPDQTLLELAIRYRSLGRDADAVALLELAQGPPSERSTGPGGESGQATGGIPRTYLIRAWHAFLTRDPKLLDGAGDPGLVFPYRPESSEPLRWAVAQSRDWAWRYLFLLNQWGLGQFQPAVSLALQLQEEPDWGPFYAARGLLLQEIRGTDPQADLRRAVALDPGNRILHVYLIRHLQDTGAWTPSLEALQEAAERFPEDFTLDLLKAKALIHTGRPLEAAEILAATRVLPSENGRESHLLWEQAHTLAGLSALEAEDAESARRDLLLAMEWPEHLGQGRPYQPEERLPRFLLGMAEEVLSHEGEARDAYEAVVAGTPGLARVLAEGSDTPIPALRSGLDLLAISALERLGRDNDVERLLRSWDAAMEEAMEELDGDLKGAMILRALRLSSGPLGLVGPREVSR